MLNPIAVFTRASLKVAGFSGHLSAFIVHPQAEQGSVGFRGKPFLGSIQISVQSSTAFPYPGIPASAKAGDKEAAEFPASLKGLRRPFSALAELTMAPGPGFPCLALTACRIYTQGLLRYLSDQLHSPSIYSISCSLLPWPVATFTRYNGLRPHPLACQLLQKGGVLFVTASFTGCA